MNLALLVLPAALAAGAAALLLELSWLRSASAALPGVVPAAALVVPAFLAAWALGSALAGRDADRSASQAATAARWLLAAAVAAWLLPRLAALAAGDAPAASRAARLAVGALPVLPAALALGGALPLLVSLRAAQGVTPGRATGAVALALALGGALACRAFPAFLTHGPAPLAAASVLLALAALWCWFLSHAPRHAPVLPAGHPVDEALQRSGRDAGRVGRLGSLILCAAALLGGALLVAGQAGLLRVAAQSRGDTLTTTGDVLAWLHLGMAAGALALCGPWRPGSALSLCALLLATAGLALALPGERPAFLGAALDPLVPAFGLGLGAGSLVSAAARAGRRPAGRLGSWVGDLAALSTVGGAAGGLAWIALLHRGWDTPALLSLVSRLALGGALLAAVGALRPAGRRAGPALALLLVLGAVGVGWSAPRAEFPWRTSADEQRLLARAEGLHGVADVVELDDGSLRLKRDGLLGMGGGGSSTLARRLGRLAACLQPAAGRSLVLGLGAGHTLAGLASTTRASVDCVENDDALFRLAPLASTVAGRPPGPLPPRAGPVAVHLADARAWVASHPDTYDLIVGDLFFPWLTGAGDLLAREHLRSVRRALREGGVVVQWLPLHQLPWPAFGAVARAFLDVFPDGRLVLATPLADEPLVALVGGLSAGLPAEASVDELLAAVPDPAGPTSGAELTDLHLCDAWTLEHHFREQASATLAWPAAELLSQGLQGREPVVARRSMALLADLVTPLTTASLQDRPWEPRANRERGLLLERAAIVLRELLLARAARLEGQALGARDHAGREAADADEARALLAAWSECPGHASARAALLERAAVLLRQERWEDGAALLHAALQAGRDIPLAAMLGGIYTRLGFLEQALELLESARAAGPPDRSLLLNLGAARLFTTSDDAGAAEALRAAAALGPLPALHAAALALLESDAATRVAAEAAARPLLDALEPQEAWAVALGRLLATR